MSSCNALFFYSLQLKQIIIVTSDHYSVGSQLDSECNSLTYCRTTGCIQVSGFAEVDKDLKYWRSNVTLNETDICYHHEKMFLKRYESLQKYCCKSFALQKYSVSMNFKYL